MATRTQHDGRPCRRRYPRWFGMLAALLITTVPLATDRAHLRTLPHAQAAASTLIQVTLTPAQGPAGTTVSLTAVGFPDTGIQATIYFDSANTQPLDTRRTVACLFLRTYGFGAGCDGVVVTETVPASAAPGPHHFLVNFFGGGGTAAFTVTVPASPTPPPLPTATNSALPATPTATAQSTATSPPTTLPPTATVTGLPATYTATAQDTAISTPTIAPASATPTPTLTTPPTSVGTVATATATPAVSPSSTPLPSTALATATPAPASVVPVTATPPAPTSSATTPPVPSPSATAPCTVRVSSRQIPLAQRPLSLYRLSAAPAPVAFARRTLVGAGVGRRLIRVAYKGQGAALVAYDKGHLAAFLDLTSGDAQVFAALDRQRAGQLNGRGATASANAAFFGGGLLPKDVTRAVLTRPVFVAGASARRTRSTSTIRLPQRSYLAYVAAQRYAGGYAVYGPGSRALLAVGSNGVTQGFLRRWKAAALAGTVADLRSRDDVVRAICGQVQPFTTNGQVTLDGVQLAYYDGNRAFLQPVYRFTATIHYASLPARLTRTGRHPADDHVIGYVPAGAREVEALPALTGKAGPQPAAASNPRPQSLVRRLPSGRAAGPAGFAVGRYVVRNDDPNWVADANEFWDGMNALWPRLVADIKYGAAATPRNTQYYWAEPRLFTSQASSFVNRVGLALTEAHGNWGLFSTLKNCCDVVALAAILATGYGGGADGTLATWIIHACEVIPAPTDTSASYDSWWRIFNGLHSAIGYRTEMYIDDDVSGPYGRDLSLGAPVVSAWLTEVAIASAYTGGPTYYDANRKMTEPLGRASTVSACGHADDSIYDAAPLPRATCLQTWWLAN